MTPSTELVALARVVLGAEATQEQVDQLVGHAMGYRRWLDVRRRMRTEVQEIAPGVTQMRTWLEGGAR